MKSLLIILISLMYIIYIGYEISISDDKQQLKNKDLAIQSLVDYYEDEDRKLLLQANEMIRLRGIK